MIHLAWPLLLLLLPLPLAVRHFSKPIARGNPGALRLPDGDLFPEMGHSTRSAPHRAVLVLALIAWSLLVLAASRPQWLGDPIRMPQAGRDMMLAVDLSESMQERDFVLEGRNTDRLSATKAVVRDFLQRRRGDRVGLILFGTRPYLQAPLSFDLKTVEQLLLESAIGLAGESTALGDAIALGVKRLQGEEQPHRVLILLTDGANTAGELSPRQAADIAAEKQVRIYSIGVGADVVMRDTLFGPRPVRVETRLDEATLKEIAGRTGGRYFRAQNTEELDEIARIIDALEPLERRQQSFRPLKELFVWPLALALILALAAPLCAALRR